MHPVFQDLLDRIPAPEAFLTLAELDQSTKDLCARYPDQASYFTMGHSREGRPLLCLKIGQGEKNVLMFGLPHPNEPIGTMMLEYLAEELASNAALREKLPFTFYLVKAWDADGFVLNEGWLKGPFNLSTYATNFFRPAGHKQVDWTFPVNYKGLSFDQSIPETTAMMALIDEIKPFFIYSLHNAGFGGVYWYISRPLDGLYEAMYKAAERVDIPLNLGEPEVPYLKSFAPAIYQGLGIEQEVDYLLEHGITNIQERISCGNCSESYARVRHDSFTLLTELPYFYDARIKDQSAALMTRKEAMLQRLDQGRVHSAKMRQALAALEDIIDPENPFFLALTAFSKEGADEGTRRMIETNPDFERKASVAEAFDSIELSRFYQSLSTGMLARMPRHELERMAKHKEVNPEKKARLEAAEKEAKTDHLHFCEELEARLNYQVIPIQKLVSIQLECGLLVMDYLHKAKT